MGISRHEDMGYVTPRSKLFIKNNFGCLSIHSLRFSIKYTDEQKQENLKAIETLSPEEYKERCRLQRIISGRRMEEVIDAIAAEFDIYQYKDTEIVYALDEWDLFLWHNHKDFTYITMNPNGKKKLKQRLADIDGVLKITDSLEYNDIDIAIQYEVEYNMPQISDMILSYYKEIEDQFIKYENNRGKIKMVSSTGVYGERFSFYKKGARSKCQEIGTFDMLELALAD